ncbi:MAG: hypothetical protein HY900_02300 [Deltaproteobacteria bacterium]|nr:hypothetical protein [Deltaproteobacteria bacterium]
MMQGDVPSDHVPIGASQRQWTTAVDVVLAVAACGVMLAWLIGHPVFYTPAAPVMSPFTAFSLLIMVLVRQARIHVETWPMALSLAMTGLVLGGNVSSIVMLAMMPPELWASFSGIVLTSTMTSIGLALFCLYDLVIALRDTPESAFLMDDMLIHLALVPGGLSLLGYLLGNPTYLSVHADPRVGISLLEMAFMALFAASAVISNPRLFLWRFLATSWTNRLVFAGLFVNQFVAPILVALLFSPRRSTGPGIELFVMLAGVVTTLSFLLLQARVVRRQNGKRKPVEGQDVCSPPTP